MNRLARLYRLVALVALLPLLLVACGGGAGTAATTSAPAATAMMEATSAPAATAMMEATSAPAATAMMEATSMATEAATAMMATEAATAMMATSTSMMTGTAMATSTSMMTGTAMATSTSMMTGTAMATSTSMMTGTAMAGGTVAPGGTIRVGSKNFTEEFIVGEMYALVLENAGFKVERKLNLGDTPVAQAALLSGDLDLYPEYTSTGLLTVLKKPVIADPTEIYNAVKSGYEQQFKLTWLTPSPFNDTEGLAVTKATADKYNLKTFSDVSKIAGQLTMGGAPEFAEREDGIKGLQKAYGGFQFKEFKQLGTGVLRYDALKSGDIDVVEVFTTDARIATDGLVVLQDDKTFYPIYNVAPVIRQDVLAANPKIADTLNKLAPLLTDAVITKLNSQVDIDGKEYEEVAKTFLQDQNLISK